MPLSKSRPDSAGSTRRAKPSLPPPGQIQAARREAAEQRLLEAAITLIAERGIKGTTLGDVGEAAGYSTGLTAHHYKSKEGLLKAVAKEIHRRFRQAVADAALPEPGLERIVAAVDIYLSFKDAQTARVLALLQKEALTERSEYRGILRKFDRQSIDGIVRQIQAGIDKGEIRSDLNPLAEGTLILAALRGVRMLWLQAPDRVDLKKVARELKNHLRRSLSATRP
jgi:AcrR family transcriptional regulator